MLLQTVPTVPNAKVIKEEIIYNDTVLDYSESLVPMITTCIEHVGYYSLETCIKMILEENTNTVFFKTQYSKANRKVYFYTNQPITTNNWDKREAFYPAVLSKEKAIIAELYTTLIKDYQKYSDCISLYDIKKYLSKINSQYTPSINSYYNYVAYTLGGYIHNPYVKDISAYNNKVIIKYVSGYIFSSFDDYKIVFKRKENSDYFYVSESNSLYADDILKILSKELPRLYSDFINYQRTQSLFCLDQKTIDSKLFVTINNSIINIFSIYAPSTCFKNFELSTNIINNSYKCSSNNKNITDILKGHEEELLKKLFIKIDDCPYWSKQDLYQIRHNQLEKQEKKQKILKKLFPWKNN